MCEQSDKNYNARMETNFNSRMYEVGTFQKNYIWENSAIQIYIYMFVYF